MWYQSDMSVLPIGLRVLVVAGDLLARAGLASLLDDQPGVDVVGQTDGDRLDDEIEVYRPDILVWDAGVWDSGVDGGSRGFPQNFSKEIPAIALVSGEATASAARRRGIDGDRHGDGDRGGDLFRRLFWLECCDGFGHGRVHRCLGRRVKRHRHGFRRRCAALCGRRRGCWVFCGRWHRTGYRGRRWGLCGRRFGFRGRPQHPCR